ncbi:unnamed protein product [Closterium sp. NIES-54]
MAAVRRGASSPVVPPSPLTFPFFTSPPFSPVSLFLSRLTLPASDHPRLARMELVNADPPAQCSSIVTSAVLSAVQELGLSHQRMVSRAYHDALFMARVAPTGMIFIPCRGGVSHRPDAFTSKANPANGVRVLALTLAKPLLPLPLPLLLSIPFFTLCFPQE